MEFQHFFRAFFAYFDERKCRWITENDSCDDYVTDSDVTFSGDTDSETDLEIDSDTNVEDAPDTDTNGVDETSSSDGLDMTDSSNADNSATETDEDTNADTDVNSDVTDVTTEKPFYQNLECEPLDETWMCSSGPKNHSLCIKFCTIGLDLLHSTIMGSCHVIHLYFQNLILSRD